MEVDAASAEAREIEAPISESVAANAELAGPNESGPASVGQDSAVPANRPNIIGEDPTIKTRKVFSAPPQIAGAVPAEDRAARSGGRGEPGSAHKVEGVTGEAGIRKHEIRLHGDVGAGNPSGDRAGMNGQVFISGGRKIEGKGHKETVLYSA